MEHSGGFVRTAAELALGVWGWSPEAFWAATPADWMLALAGWQRAQGISPAVAPLGRADLLALMAKEGCNDGNAA